VRHLLQVYVAWFTFFIALLIAAMGWSLKASISTSGLMRRPLPFALMYALFMAQLGLSIVATNALISDVQAASQRILSIIAVANASTMPPPIEVHSPIPAGIETSLCLMWITLWGNVAFWTIVAVLVFFAWRKKWIVASNAV